MPSLIWYDLLIGVLAAAGATWVSLHLLPPSLGQLHLGRLLLFLPRFLLHSVLAGWDVARRVFDPKLPLHPGFVTYPTHFAAGFARNTFASITSLLPGSVPAGETEHGIVYHALDVSQPLIAQLRAEEQLLTQTLAPTQPTKSTRKSNPRNGQRNQRRRQR